MTSLNAAHRFLDGDRALYRVFIYSPEGELAEIFQGRPIQAYGFFVRARDAGLPTYMRRLTPDASAREHAAGRSAVHEIM